MKIAGIIGWTLLGVVSGYGESAEAPAHPPDVLLKVVQAAQSSKAEALVSQRGDSSDTYHLRDAHYLGYIMRDGKSYTVAWLFYVRSRPEGREKPLARGHDFIVILDPDFKIVSCGQAGGGPYRMEGDKLFDAAGEAADFQSKDIVIRHGGYPISGGSFLPYPFPDRITDEEWDRGSFKR